MKITKYDVEKWKNDYMDDKSIHMSLWEYIAT